MNNVPLGYKLTEVGVIPEDWVLSTVGEISDVKTGPFGSALHEKDYVDDGTPIITVEHLGERGIHHANLPMVSEIDRVRLKAYSLRQGDIVFSRVGSVDRNALVRVDEEGWLFSGRLLRVRLKCQGVVAPYLSYHFHSESFKQRVRDVAVGQTMASINTKILMGVRMVLPPTKAEQEAIAGALSDADALIESLEQLIAKKRHLKQGAMQELLTGKRRLPGFETVGAIHELPLQNVPHGWEAKRLGELASISRGASPRPIDSPIWFDENSTIGWVRISDITKSEMFLRETTQRLSLLGIKNSRPVNRGSLIMSICATVGRPVITEIDTCIHDGFVVFDAPRVNQLFLYYVLKSIEGDWGKHGQTGSQMNLNTGLINRTEIFVPKDEAEQTAIATILSDMDTEIAALETKLAKTRSLKQGMMHNLLTGRIRLI
jgi:type I restriction enzyme S subunit